MWLLRSVHEACTYTVNEKVKGRGVGVSGSMLPQEIFLRKNASKTAKHDDNWFFKPMKNMDDQRSKSLSDHKTEMNWVATERPETIQLSIFITHLIVSDLRTREDKKKNVHDMWKSYSFSW